MATEYEIVGHFWNGDHREVTRTSEAEMRGAMPPSAWARLMRDGMVQRGWSDFYRVPKGEAGPTPRWVAGVVMDRYLLTMPDGTQVCRECDYVTDYCKCGEEGF